MKVDLHEEIEIAEGINSSIENNELIMKNSNGELRRKLNNLVNVKLEGNKIILEVKNATKRERKVFGTMMAHFNNMNRGLTEKFKYKLEIAFVHFPMTVSYDKGKNTIIIKNFLGEKTDRIIKIKPGAVVKVDKQIIEIESINKELAGQIAADIEKAAKPKDKDRRIYQDGIYIIEKPGREF